MKYIEDRARAVSSYLEHIDGVRVDAVTIKTSDYVAVRNDIEAFLLNNLPVSIKKKYWELQQCGESLCLEYPWAAMYTAEVWGEESFLREPAYLWNDALVEAYRRVHHQ